MFDVAITGATELIDRLGVLPQQLHDALLVKMIELELRVIARVREKLSGEVLRSKSGALRDSIRGDINDSPTRITATVGSYGTAYAAIQEFGGRTAAHDIVPSKAQALAFMMEGKMIFAKVVHHPGSNIPARSYLNSTLEEMAPEIRAGLLEAAREGAQP